MFTFFKWKNFFKKHYREHLLKTKLSVQKLGRPVIIIGRVVLMGQLKYFSRDINV